jgi:hypothetical protein
MKDRFHHLTSDALFIIICIAIFNLVYIHNMRYTAIHSCLVMEWNVVIIKEAINLDNNLEVIDL